VLADPPYGIDFESGRQKAIARKLLGGISNDKAPFVWFLYHAAECLKDGGCLLCFSRWDVQDVFLRAVSLAGLTVRSVVVWDKMTHGMGNLKAAFAPSYETAIFATKGKYEFPGKRPKDVFKVMKVASGKLEHPNEKPVELMEQLVDATCPEGGTVLDPFMGAGSAGIACANSGREYVGIEIDEGYYELAKRRIADAFEKRAVEERNSE
jgi:DNA modification methylase